MCIKVSNDGNDFYGCVLKYQIMGNDFYGCVLKYQMMEMIFMDVY
jgi:hypothetical protein